MPPGKAAPNTGSHFDGDGGHPGKIVKLSSSDANLSGSSSLQPVSTSAKQVYTILSEDDDEENQLRDGYETGRNNVDKILSKTGSQNTDDDPDQLNGEAENEVSIDENSSTKERLRVLAAQAGPVTISFFLGFAGTFTNLIFASHFVGDDGSASTVFAGVSLANMFANVSCMSLLIGMSSAVETLGSQFNGAKAYKEVGVTLWKCMMILGLMLPFIAVTWYFTGEIFRALGIHESVCLVIERYIRIRSMTLPMDVVNISFEKYLMSIGVVKPSMWCNICFNVSLLLLNSLFVFVLHWDYTCLAYSWVISTYIMAAVQWSLSWNHPSVQRTLQPWSRDSLKGWGQFISLGLPGTVMLCSEWWAYEVLNLFASFKDTGAAGNVGSAVAAQTIILQTASLVFMIPLGLGVASASLVGNAIGAKKRALAIQLGWLAISVIVVLEIGVAASIFFFGIHFVDFFTADPGVRKLAEGSLTFLSIFCFFDAVQGVLGGILRGSGKQMVGAAANIIAFYVIGLPLAYHFCFHTSMGIPGLMLGLSGGVIFQDIVLLFLIICCESFIFPIDSTITAYTMSSSQHGLVSDYDEFSVTGTGKEQNEDESIELKIVSPARNQ